MKQSFWITAICAIMTASSIDAAYTVVDGGLVNVDDVATKSAEEHFRLGQEALQNCDYREAIKQFRITVINYSATRYGADAHYYLGLAYFQHGEYDCANKELSEYLAVQNNPEFFQEAIEYKFSIAEKFRQGAKRHLFGQKSMPQWQTGRTLAIEIYDEVVVAAPSHDLAAHSLYSKGALLWNMREYRDSIEAYQMLIRRFPKHELAPEAYVTINRVYLDLAKLEYGNPDILAFAEMNLRKFSAAFPRDERITDAEHDVLSIKEQYANGLYQTGCFYERINQPKASIIYYQKAINQFPETNVANCCQKRIEVLAPRYAAELLYDEESVESFDIEPFESPDDQTS